MANGYGAYSGLPLPGGDLTLPQYNYNQPLTDGRNPLSGIGGMMMGAGAGQLLQGLGLFGESPQDAAQQYLGQVPGQMREAYDPYIQAGQQELPQLQQQYQQLMQDPGARMQQMGQGFQESPGFQYSVGEATRAANQASAARGMLGTPQEQKQLAGQVQGMANQDYYNYLNHAMNLYGQGLQGAQGLYDTGFQASSQLAGNIANALASQAQLGYAGAQQQQQGMGGGIGALIGGAFESGLF